MSQSRLLSAVEAGTNVAVGFGLAVCVQLAVFPAFGLLASPGQHLTIGAVFTLVSLVRSYALRRLFERIGRKSRYLTARRSGTAGLCVYKKADRADA